MPNTNGVAVLLHQYVNQEEAEMNHQTTEECVSSCFGKVILNQRLREHVNFLSILHNSQIGFPPETESNSTPCFYIENSGRRSRRRLYSEPVTVQPLY